MVQLVWWLIIGLVAGSVARLLIPGRQPMGLLWTTGLGLIGSIMGGFISSVVFGYDPLAPGYHLAGLGMSTVGALLVLGAFVAFSRRSTRLARVNLVANRH
jgi:uncharacterized membrane protein YeaQ/YmgE (transglycosylase-associated protein family)